MTAREASRWSWPHLVVMQRSGARPPLVLIPGLRGSALRYHALVSLLGSEQPVWAMQLLGEHPDETVAEYSVEEIAGVFEPQVVSAIPSGPIVLGGFSMGSLIALELTRRLQRRGRDVPLLVSLDGYAPRYQNQPVARAARLRAHASSLRAAPHAYVEQRLRRWREQLLATVGLQWLLVPELRALQPGARARRQQLAALRERAALRYLPNGATRVPFLLIRASRADLPLGSEEDACHGWRPFIEGPISVVSCAGTHQTVMESDANRRAMAEAITRAIAEVDAGRPLATPV